MFNNSKPGAVKATRKGAAPRDLAVTILTSGCHFSGKLYCRGSSRIAGKIEGTIVSEGLLVIEEEALIVAEINADDVVIQGHVKGKVVATGKVELCSASHFEGDIMTPCLVVNEGAQFNGRSTMLAAKNNADFGIPIGGGPDADTSNDHSHQRSPEVAARTLVEAGT